LPPTNDYETNDEAVIQAGFRYALSLTHNRHDAEDLVQYACLRIFRAKGRLTGKRYLFVTIRNAYIDRCRKRDESSTCLPNEGTVPSEEADHESIINDRLDIETMLQFLRSEEREVLYLTYVEGYTAAEVAEITNQKRGTILSQISRAKAKLVRRYGTAKVI